jgi:flagellin
MALVVNTNVASITSQMYVNQTNKDMADTMARLSSGKRINTAADDAAGVAIASRLSSEIRGTNQAVRNALDAQAMIDTGEGAMQEIESLLQRMREIAVQSANDTNSTSDRTALQNEMTQLTNEINRVASVTTWAGNKLLDGTGGTGSNGSFTFHIGARTSAGSDQTTVSIAAMNADGLSIDGDNVAAANMTIAEAGPGSTALSKADGTLTFAPAVELDVGDTFSFTYDGKTVGITITAAEAGTGEAAADAAAQKLATAINEGDMGITAVAAKDGTGVISVKEGSLSVASASAALTTITALDTAITTLNTERAELGAVSNRLDNTVANLSNIAINLGEGRSRIEDADFAQESANLAKQQIMLQAGTAMLAQANASQQNVLSLLG